MLFQCYLRRGIVYVPTTAKRGTSVYTAIEPVAVVSAADAEGPYPGLCAGFFQMSRFCMSATCLSMTSRL
jgi:hypothetical protein